MIATHHASEYHSVYALAGLSYPSWCCYFKGNASTKLLIGICLFIRHSDIHVLAELVCLLAELRYILVLIVFSKDMLQTSYGLDLCVFFRHLDVHLLAELKYILVNYVLIFMWRSYYSVCLPVKLHVDIGVFSLWRS